MSVRPSITNVVLERLKSADHAAEDTVEMARQVQAMLDSPGWGFLTDFLDQMVEGIDMRLERGIHEQAEYVAMVAERRSLRTAVAVADGIVLAGERAERDLNELAARLAAEDA